MISVDVNGRPIESTEFSMEFSMSFFHVASRIRKCPATGSHQLQGGPCSLPPRCTRESADSDRKRWDGFRESVAISGEVFFLRKINLSG